MGRKPKRIPVIGDVFGEWTIIGAPDGDDRVSLALWKCRCACGEIKEVKGHNLLGGGSKSCGHVWRKGFARHHGLRTRQHLARLSWRALLFKVERGEIEIDPKWKMFEQFFADLGERLTHTVLSRRDLDGPYTAENCFWEERREQIKRLRAKKYADASSLAVKDGSTKWCPKCEDEKSRDDFYVNNASKSKRHSHCKLCMREENRAFDMANPAKAMVDRARARARDKGFEFALRPEHLEPLPTHCPVFGFALRRGNGQQDPTAYSLDRIDNKKGYVPGNVVVMSYLANRLKNDGTAAQHARLAQWMSAIEMVPSRLSETAGASAGLL